MIYLDSNQLLISMICDIEGCEAMVKNEKSYSEYFWDGFKTSGLSVFVEFFL